MAYFVPNTYSIHQMIRFTFPLVNAFLQHYVSQENLNNFLTARARIFFFFFSQKKKKFFLRPSASQSVSSTLQHSYPRQYAWLYLGKRLLFRLFLCVTVRKKTVFGGLINESKLGFSWSQNKFFVGLQRVFNR